MHDELAEAGHLAGTVGDGPLHVREHAVRLVARPSGDDLRVVEPDAPARLADHGEGRRAHEDGLDAGGPGALDDDVHLAMEARCEVAPVDDVAREGAHLVPGPSGEAPRHDLAHALLGIRPREIPGVNPARNLRTLAGIREAVVARRLSKSLQGRGFHASVVQEGVKEVVAHVPAPEGAVAVGGDDAARSLAGERLDACPDVVGALLLHAASITDRSRPGLD